MKKDFLQNVFIINFVATIINECSKNRIDRIQFLFSEDDCFYEIAASTIR